MQSVAHIVRSSCRILYSMDPDALKLAIEKGLTNEEAEKLQEIIDETSLEPEEALGILKGE